MTDDGGQRYYDLGESAYQAGNLVTALRWWLQGVDAGHEASLTDALDVSRSDDQSNPWDQLLGAIAQVKVEWDLTSTQPSAEWSQFSLAPMPDLATLSDPFGAPFEQGDQPDDPEWRRILEYLEYRNVTFDSFGCSFIAVVWQAEFDWPVPIMIGIEPIGTPGRSLRISTPLLIGLPAPGMAPNMGNDESPQPPVPQAGFVLPLRPMQTLFAQGCLKLADQGRGILSLMPSMRFIGVPEELQPRPRVAVGRAGWIIGPDAAYPLRHHLPQVTIGYELDLSLSGPHLDTAFSGAVDSLVESVAKANEACERQSAIFCEYITSIANLVAHKQWADLFADFVYPSHLGQATVLAEAGDPAAMVDLASYLFATPGYAADSHQWYDSAIALGYTPGLANKTWALLTSGEFSAAAAEWAQHQAHCRDQALLAAEPERSELLRILDHAEANASVAEFLNGENPQDCRRTWESLALQGNLETRIYSQSAQLMGKPDVTADDYREAGQTLAQRYPDDDWLGLPYLALATGFHSSTGPFREWSRHGLEVCIASGLSIRFHDFTTADNARSLGRNLIEAGDASIGEPLQEAAVRFGLPYAGADHSWRLLQQGRFLEAIALFGEVADTTRGQVTALGHEIPDIAETLTKELANYQSNIALCHIGAGREADWALRTWHEGASTGNVESIFYPAVVAFRKGDTQEAQNIVASMSGQQIAEMTAIAFEGARASAEFWRNWSQDGLRLLQARDSLEPTHTGVSNGLSAHKTSSGLGTSGLSIPPVEPERDAPAVAEMDGFKFCPQCGTSRVSGASFCVSCGYAFP